MNGSEVQFLPVGGAPIAYRYAPPKGDAPVFVWFCGFRSDMQSLKAEALAAWAASKGAGCLRFDYSGHGQSGGRFEDGTISQWLHQAECVANVASTPKRQVFAGSSMGGWIALLLARRLVTSGHPPPKGIALIAPAWDMTKYLWERSGEAARTAIETDGFFLRPSAYGDGPYTITKTLIDDGEHHLFGDGPLELKGPIRILQGMQDVDVPPAHSLRLLDVVSAEDVRITLVKDAGHRLSREQDLDLLFSLLSEFL